MDPVRKYHFKLEGDLADFGESSSSFNGDHLHLSLALLVDNYSSTLRDYLGDSVRLIENHLVYTKPIPSSEIPVLLEMEEVLAISLIHQTDKLPGKVQFANVGLDLEQLTES